MARLDIFWSVRSPYCFMSIDRLCAIQRGFDIEVVFRPVRPLLVREPNAFKDQPFKEQRLAYFMKDIFREAERLGYSPAWPNPDPLKTEGAPDGTNPLLHKISTDQPYVDLLHGLILAAGKQGAALDFVRAAVARMWNGEPGWDEDASLKAIAEEAGLEFSTLRQWAAANQDEITATIIENETDQLKHHWGVPLMVLDDEPFFGQDRIDALVWRLEKKGLKRD